VLTWIMVICDVTRSFCS